MGATAPRGQILGHFFRHMTLDFFDGDTRFCVYRFYRGTGFQPVAGYGLEARATLGCGRTPAAGFPERET